MMRRCDFFPFILVFAVIACGKSSESSKRPPSSAFDLNGKPLLIFSATDVKLESSALYVFDEESSAVQPILHGQSGDLLVKNVEGRIFGFNRKAEQHDYFELTPVKNDDGTYTFVPSDAHSLKDLSVGDPHDVVLLDKEHLLLVNYISETLGVLEIGSNKITKVTNLNFGLKEGAPLRFESGKKLSNGSIVLLHQGVSATYDIDTTQAAYFVTWDKEAKRLEFKDNAARRPKLVTSLPTGIFTDPKSESFATISLCSDFYVSCRPGIEYVSIKSGVSVQDPGYDFTGLGFYGGTTYSAHAQTIYASVRTPEKKKKIMAFDLANGKQRDVFSFPDGLFNGYWGLIYNEESRSLYVADAVTERKGQITIIKESGEEKTVETPAIPYSGAIYSAH